MQGRWEKYIWLEM